MQCPNCHETLIDSARFCNKCGCKIEQDPDATTGESFFPAAACKAPSAGQAEPAAEAQSAAPKAKSRKTKAVIAVCSLLVLAALALLWFYVIRPGGAPKAISADSSSPSVPVTANSSASGDTAAALSAICAPAEGTAAYFCGKPTSYALNSYGRNFRNDVDLELGSDEYDAPFGSLNYNDSTCPFTFYYFFVGTDYASAPYGNEQIIAVSSNQPTAMLASQLPAKSTKAQLLALVGSDKLKYVHTLPESSLESETLESWSLSFQCNGLEFSYVWTNEADYENSAAGTASVSLIGAKPDAAQAAVPASAADDSGYHSTAYGCTYNVPAGFHLVSPEESASGHVYEYNNPELNMNISVSEEALAALGNVSLADDYAYYRDAYSRSSQGITYSVNQKNHFVLSGWLDSSTVYYRTEIEDENNCRITIQFTYDSAQKSKCDSIVSDFMSGFKKPA